MIALVAVAGIWLALGWWQLHSGWLHIPLPTGIPLPEVVLFSEKYPGRPLPIPVLFWAGWLAYAALLRQVRGGALRAWLGQTFWPALTAQVLLLVTDLDRIIWTDGVTFLEIGYLAYYVAGFCALLAGLSFAAARHGRSAAAMAADAVWLPTYGAAAILLGALALAGRWWAGVPLMAGAALGWAWSRAGWLPARWAALRRWLATPSGALTVLGLLALISRIIYSIRLVEASGIHFPAAGDDSDTNDGFAWQLAQAPARILEIDPQVVYPPGYWMFLAVIYRVFGHHFLPVVFVQSLASAIVPPCVYLLTRRLLPTLGHRTAVLAGLLAVFNTPLIHVAATLDQEAVFMPLLLVGLLALLRGVPAEGPVAWRWLWAAGAFIGLANFMRPITIYFPLVVLAWVATARRRLWPAVQAMIHFTIPMVLVVVPLFIRNVLASGHLTMTSEAAIHYHKHSNDALIALGVDPFVNVRGTVAAFLQQPAAVWQAIWDVVPVRIVQFLFVSFFGVFDPVQMLNPGTVPTAYAMHVEFYAYLAILIGFWWMARRRESRRETLFLLWVTAYFLLQPVLFFVRNATYRIPLYPVFYVWLAAGAVLVWSWTRRWGGRAA
jgi:hypothetical protein